MAKKDNYTEITPEVVDELKEAEELDLEDFDEEEEDDMVEKNHPIKDFVGKHKKGLIAVGLTVGGFVLGCIAGSKTKKDNSAADSADDENQEIDCIEQSDQESVVESTATEVE